MKQEELADLLIERLNEIASHDPKWMRAMIEERVPCNKALADHPTVLVGEHDGEIKAGLLGLLNGLVGTIPSGKRKGWGFIVAVFADDTGAFQKFQRTDLAKLK